jgi:hypoxanthine-DNA glycosylase
VIETHPFGCFVPDDVKYLILGSFPGIQTLKGKSYSDETYDWFYGSKRNQFWPILESVYQCELKTRQFKENLLAGLHIAIGDIIYQCERIQGNNSDNNLIIVTYATQEITQILQNHPIRKIFFTSRFVEIKYRQYFMDLIGQFPKNELVTLPSPSPRYARLTKEQKIKIYKCVLPTALASGE